MGIAIERDRFDEEEYARFGDRLERCLLALEELLRRPGFGEGPPSLGAEIEVFLADRRGRPLPLNHSVIAETADPRVTLELDRFNLECNLRPVELRGRPFDFLRCELVDALTETRRAASRHGGRVAVIGILPTLRANDLQRSSMTDLPRYRALSAGLQRLRREPFQVNISGDDPLRIACDDITFEGANTSFQVHLRVPPARFADTYNAAQLATAPVLAVAGNSPTFLGHRLWEETRVALFKQAVDERHGPDRRAARVSFGSDWVRQGPLELFLENLRIHEPLLPILGDEDPIDCLRAGGTPRLDELRLHQGTVWRWNRAIFDPVGGGHLRIEMRALPAGPAVPDMVANTAFLVGLALGLAPDAGNFVREFPFGHVEYNFYRSAQHGLDARLLWPEPGGRVIETSARDLVLRLVSVARRGLDAAAVDSTESERWLGLIAERARTGQTGAVWQRRALEAAETCHSREAALGVMLERYLEHAAGDEPVHRWPLEP